MTQPKKTTSKKKKTPVKSALPATHKREIWAVVCVLLAVLVPLTFFIQDGAVLGVLSTLFRSLFGSGVYLLPLAFAGMAALLIVQKKGPVRLRLFCTFSLPILWGGMVQGLWHGHTYTLSVDSLMSLLSATPFTGGLLGGTLYELFEWALSDIGSIFLLALLFILCVLVALRITPSMIVEMFTPPEYTYEDETEREKYEAPPTLPKLRQKKPTIDIPLEDPPAKMTSFDIPLDEVPIPPKTSVDTNPSPMMEKPTPKAPFDIPLDDTPLPESEALPDPLPVHQYEHYTSRSSWDIPVMDTPPAPAPTEKPAVPEVTPSDMPPWNEPTKTENVQQDLPSPMPSVPTPAPSTDSVAPIYSYPSLALLTEVKKQENPAIREELVESSERLLDTLSSFGIDAQIINVVRGPSVTRFELTIERGVKFSRITSLSDDIALALGAMSVRIAPIPDKIAIGIEVPNKHTSTVYIRDVLSSPAFSKAKSQLSFAVGKDITGAPVVGDIATMPHMLIAGTTGSGKSVCINSMLISLLYKSTPEQVRLIMIDPKMVELGNYNGIPHLLIPVVTDPQKASGALTWAVIEMERRYKLFSDHAVRNLSEFNALMKRKQAEPPAEDAPVQSFETLPQIVIVIDELADLMMVAAKEVETSICRIAQKARAAGMHLVVATQRPSADVITGIMKANIPSRIAFAVASQIESRIILDTPGADKLIGKGDMLYAPIGKGKPTRVQGCFISNDEIESVIVEVKASAQPDYNDEILAHIEKQAESGGTGGTGDGSEDEDELIWDAIDIIMESRQASTSALQRRLKLGYARAARIIDQIEERGIIGPSEGAKPRQIYITREEWQEMKTRRRV